MDPRSVCRAMRFTAVFLPVFFFLPTLRPLSEEITEAMPTHEPVPIIFDTDMETDCDDAAALGILHALADNGECEILATMSSALNPWSAATVDAINTYYGRPHIPVGNVKGPGVDKPSRYAEAVAGLLPHRLQSGDDAPDAAGLYREILEAQPDGSVTIVTVGYLTNLANLLRLPAEENQAAGMDLIRRKVRLWVCMGGNFIGSPPRDDGRLGNHNFEYDAAAALHAVRHWPTPVVFAGREVCSVPSGLKIGADLAKTPAHHPVRVAYEKYFGGQAADRHVADPVSVLFAVRGQRDCWDLSEPGTMVLSPDMTFAWRADSKGRQRYLLKKTVNGVPNDRFVEGVLNALLLRPPRLSRYP